MRTLVFCLFIMLNAAHQAFAQDIWISLDNLSPTSEAGPSFLMLSDGVLTMKMSGPKNQRNAGAFGSNASPLLLLQLGRDALIFNRHRIDIIGSMKFDRWDEILGGAASEVRSGKAEVYDCGFYVKDRWTVLCVALMYPEKPGKLFHRIIAIEEYSDGLYRSIHYDTLLDNEWFRVYPMNGALLFGRELFTNLDTWSLDSIEEYSGGVFYLYVYGYPLIKLNLIEGIDSRQFPYIKIQVLPYETKDGCPGALALIYYQNIGRVVFYDYKLDIKRKEMVVINKELMNHSSSGFISPDTIVSHFSDKVFLTILPVSAFAYDDIFIKSRRAMVANSLYVDRKWAVSEAISERIEALLREILLK